MKQKMTRMLLPLMLIFFGSPALAFQCDHDHSVEKAFMDAERGFLIYVTETKLEEALLKKMNTDMDVSVIPISAGYRVVEEFKGKSDYRPRLLDFLGISTGYVGLTPGVYFLVLLQALGNDDDPELRYVSFCTVPLKHYRLNVPEFQKKLEQVRKLRDGS